MGNRGLEMVNKKVLEAINLLIDNQCINCWHYEIVVFEESANHYCKKYFFRKNTFWSNSCSMFRQTTPTRFVLHSCKSGDKHGKRRKVD